MAKFVCGIRAEVCARISIWISIHAMCVHVCKVRVWNSRGGVCASVNIYGYICNLRACVQSSCVGLARRCVCVFKYV